MNIHLFRLKFAILYFGCFFLSIGLLNFIQHFILKHYDKKYENNLIYTIIFIIIGIALIIVYVYPLKIELEKCDKKKKDEIEKKIKTVEIYFAVSTFLLSFFLSYIFFSNSQFKKNKFRLFNQKMKKRNKNKRQTQFDKYTLIELLTVSLYLVSGLGLFGGCLILYGTQTSIGLDKMYKC
tara:strand:- start:92 stop:631 length:540 start_codon:yes stop_codon:yes gene_type:complete